MQLQDLVVKKLDDPSSYHPLSEDEVIMLLGKNGFTLGAFNNRQDLIGYASAYFPAGNADNLGLDMGFTGDQLLQTAHLEAGIVSPFFRRRGWQKKLYKALVKEIVRRGEYRYILSTVSCNNYPALRNSLQLKLYIASLREKYGGKLRYLLFRDLQELFSICPADIVKCPHTDIRLQQRLLDSGYRGFQVDYSPDGLMIHYGLRN